MTHRTTMLSLGVLFTLWAVAACGGRSSLQPFEAGPPADGSGQRDLGAGVEAGRGDGAGSDLRRDDALLGSIEGQIGFWEIQDAGSGAQQGTALVFFTPSPMPFYQPIQSLGGGCSRYGLDEVGPVQYSAGRVDITVPGNSFHLDPDASAKPGDWLYQGMLYPDFFSAGSTISVRAAGDQVPAFSTSLQGVGDLPVTFPPGSMRRGQAYTLALKPLPGAGPAWVVITGLNAGGSETWSARCAVPAGATAFSIPGGLFSALPSSIRSVTLRVGLVNDTLVNVSAGVRVHLVASHMTERTVPLQ